jgi:hypothetical protein
MTPVGLDSQTNSFGVRFVNGPGDISTLVPGWKVTRIQAFAGADPATLIVAGQSQTILADGCIELLPGGAHKSTVRMLGNTYLCIIEFWFPTRADGLQP